MNKPPIWVQRILAELSFYKHKINMIPALGNE